MEPLLRIENLSRHFTVRRSFLDPSPLIVRAVDGVDLHIERGETLGLVGESGCGKSTLARMVVNLLPASGGNIFLHGQPITQDKASDLSQRLQMIFQDPFASLNPRMRIGHSIAEPLVSAGKSKAERDALVEESLVMVGLRPEHAERYPHEFSGGQRQRIAIARALIARPELVVCDEAVSSLDASVQAQVLNLLMDLQEKLGLSYLFISHDLGVVGHMSDRVAVMYLGRIVEIAPRDELFHRPSHPYTKLLLDSIPKRDPKQRHSDQDKTCEADAVGTPDMPSPLAMPQGCPFHPRCPQAMDICRQEAPSWHKAAKTEQAVGTEQAVASEQAVDTKQSRSQHLVRCHLFKA